MTRRPRKARAARRTTEDLRTALLDAARTIFSERGFAATSTRDVAQRAGAAEHLIFKHFRSKAGLFSAAVFEPLSAMLDDNLEKMDAAARRVSTVEGGLRAFVDTLHPLLNQNRRLLVAYLNAVTFHAEEFDATSGTAILSLVHYLRKLEKVRAHVPPNKDIVVKDPMVETRMSFALVFALAMFQDVLFEGREQDEVRERDSVVKLLSDGLRGGLVTRPRRAGSAGRRKR
ncbi:MAG TPA: helix-turn-helix domain-containing protein [Nevskiaceae bacterium]|nr:helix-turn-helix domain-containing protein [Nevskiaceae bacterium]